MSEEPETIDLLLDATGNVRKILVNDKEINWTEFVFIFEYYDGPNKTKHEFTLKPDSKASLAFRASFIKKNRKDPLDTGFHQYAGKLCIGPWTGDKEPEITIVQPYQ